MSMPCPSFIARLSGFTCRAATAFVVALSLLTGSVLPAAAHPHVWVIVETTVLYEQGKIVGFQHKWTFDEYYTAMAIEGLDTNHDGIYSREELSELAKVNIDGLKEFAYFTYPKLAKKELPLDAPKDFWLEYGDAPPQPAEDPQPQVGAPPSGSPSSAAPSTVPPPATPGPVAGETPPAADAKTADPAVAALGAMFGAKPDPAPNDGPVKVLTLNFTLPLKKPLPAEAAGFNFSIFDPSFFIAFDLVGKDPVKLGPGAPAGCRVEQDAEAPEAKDAQKLSQAFSAEFGGRVPGFSGARPIKVVCTPKS
jgi:ABC-type uncharacterized transport system substrate-binding protein